MNPFQKLTPEWALRLGIGLTYLYSGIDLIRHPTAWVWALPYWLRQVIGSAVPLDAYLRIQGGVEILFALALLLWFAKPALVKLVAMIAALEFGVILLLALVPWSEANFLITFRDIGLFGAAIALLLILRERTRTTP